MPQDEASGEEVNCLFYRVCIRLRPVGIPSRLRDRRKNYFSRRCILILQTADVTAARNGGQLVECSQQLAHDHSR